MEKSLFKSGDVFLFEHDESCISTLISVLTNSPISHAAMFFEDNQIVEEGLSGISTRSIDDLGDRKVYVRRHNKSEQSSSAVLLCAKQHLAEKEPYSMGNLLGMGIVLLFNRWKPNTNWLVKKLINLLSRQIAHIIDKGKTGSTCSQLVYELYKEAGFTLKINTLQQDHAFNLISLALKASESQEKLQSINVTDKEKDFEATMLSSSNFDDLFEKTCCALLAVLGDDKTKNTTESEDFVLDQDLYNEIVHFTSLVYKHDKENSNLDAIDVQKYLSYFFDTYAGFVTPGELLTNCPDLEEKVLILNG